MRCHILEINIIKANEKGKRQRDVVFFITGGLNYVQRLRQILVDKFKSVSICIGNNIYNEDSWIRLFRLGFG